MPRLVLLFSLIVLSRQMAAAADVPDFNRDVRPILSDKCFHCHGPDAGTREAELRLDDEPDAVRDRDGYKVVDRNDPAKSALLERISSSGDDRMPPPESAKPLTAAEIDILTRWLNAGGSYEKHWAYVTPVLHEPPAVSESEWPANWIDNFILSRLEQEKLPPAPEADKVTLIRRLRFDLTGLPPTPEEVDAFVNDASPEAWEKLVDRLLASDECGERLAMYWLDLVRYADTVGYHGDQDHNISPYRDYVIDAFIDNMPFDQFTREQLAGDLVENSGDDQKIASGYNRLLQTSHEGGVQPKEYLEIYAADRVRNFSNVWMGATMGCAYCHDHKYDPYSQKDVYSLIAFFADIDEAQHFTKSKDAIPAPRPPEMKLLTKRERARLAAIESELESLNAGTSESDAVSAEAVTQRREGLEHEAKEIRRWARSTMVTVPIEPRTIRLLARGNWMDESGPVMQPEVPGFLGALDISDRRPTRLDLANWLFDCEEGIGLLTARVFANRFWYLAFGEGLSRSLDDFGGQGEPPSHPELLDRLSYEFAESGWNVRHMLKLIVMSRAYRMSSFPSQEAARRDPDNRLVSRQNRFRIPAEAVRDTSLLVSGLLVQRVGGSSVKPYQPEGYYGNLNFPKREYQPDTDENQWRRGVYVHWQRQYLHPMLRAFDAPSREECTAQRTRSNTPLTSLVLLNDPSFVEAARMLAARVLREGGDSDESRLQFVFRTVLSRAPDETERQTLQALLDSSRSEYAKASEAATALTSVGDSPNADLPAEELAAWTTISRALLNLGETYLRH